MAKWEVQIFGKVPDVVIVDADNEADALDYAMTAVFEELDFQAELAEEKPKLDLIQGGLSAQNKEETLCSNPDCIRKHLQKR